MGPAVVPFLKRTRIRIFPAGLLLALVALAAPATASAAVGDISTFAGTGSAGSAGDGGAATSAQLNQPVGVTLGPNGEVYLADMANNRVRKVVGGTITTVAGTGAAGSSGDGGPATSAAIDAPTDVAVDSQGRIYIVEYGGHRIRRVSTAGTITTFAGTGQPGGTGDGGPATAARLTSPTGLAINAADELLIADYGNHRIRKVSTSGTISTVAGNGTSGFSGDGGAATLARLDLPADIAIDASGNVFVAEDGNHRVRKVTTGGTISTVAGTGAASSTGDGGNATSATLNRPIGVDVDSTGAVYIAEFGGHRVRRVGSNGVITTAAGTGTAGYLGDGGPATSARLNSPVRVTLAPGGDFYIPDFSNNRLRRVEGLGAPDAPVLTATTPASAANDNAPRVVGSAAAGTTVRLYTNATCTSGVAATGSDTQLAATGLAVSVPDDSSTSFYATATTSAGSTSGCSTAPLTYAEDSSAPAAPSIASAPPATTSSPTPAWSFSGEPEARFECRLVRDSAVLSGWASCDSPKGYDLSGEPDGSYSFSVRAIDTAGNTGEASASTFVLARPDDTPEPPVNPEPPVIPPVQKIDPATILPQSNIRVTPAGVALVRVACPGNADGYCRGTIVLQLPGAASRRASASRRRKPLRIGRKKFAIKAGERPALQVRISRRGRREVLRRKRKRCTIRVRMQMPDGTSVTTRRTIRIARRGAATRRRKK
jgi:hypothetical protein